MKKKQHYKTQYIDTIHEPISIYEKTWDETTGEIVSIDKMPEEDAMNFIKENDSYLLKETGNNYITNIDDYAYSYLSKLSAEPVMAVVRDKEPIEEQIKKIIESMNIKPTFKHKCNSCGGTLDMDINNHIFRCPYCGTVYAIGTAQINS